LININLEDALNAKFHLSLDVNNLGESVHFYSALLNAPATKLKPDYAKFDLESPPINLAMQPKTHCCLQGLSHMGLRVESAEEIQVIRKRLLDAGYNTLDENNTTCCYSLQDKFWVSDPTGYRWEVYILKADCPVQSEAVLQKCCA